jgi:hypothetical protein
MLKSGFRPIEQDTVLDLEERSDDLPALMVWCDVVAKSEVFASFIAYDSCSVSRIVLALSVVVYCEGVGWHKTKLETERKVWDKNVLEKKNSRLIIEL